MKYTINMNNQKRMATDIYTVYGRRFAKSEYWEAIEENRRFEEEQKEALAWEEYWRGC